MIGAAAAEHSDRVFDWAVTKRLLTYLAPYKRNVYLALGGAILTVSANVLGAPLIGFVVERGIQQANLLAVMAGVITYLTADGLGNLGFHVQVRNMAFAGQHVIQKLRDELFTHIQYLSLSFFSTYETGRLIARVIGDVNVLREAITFAVVGTVRDLFVLMGILIAMLVISVPLTVVALVTCITLIIVANLWRVYARQAFATVRETNAKVNAELSEAFNAVRVTQAFSREGYNYQRFAQTMNLAHRTANVRVAKIGAAFFSTIELVGGIAVGTLIFVGGSLTLNQQISVATLITFVLYIDQLFFPIRMLAQRFNIFQAVMAAGDKIFTLMDTPLEIQDAPDAAELPLIQGHVRFHDVSFAYANAEEAKAQNAGDQHLNPHSNGHRHEPTEALLKSGDLVLKGINLEVPAGCTVALVGHTGAGKTSIIKLIMRFYDVQNGLLTIDGHDIRTVTQRSLRSQMGVVTQETYLFSGTVMDNIRYGRLEANDDEVIAAAQAVGAHDFISALSEGYHTEVREGGSLLSAGQKQLIAFARALLADPRILILDEATSSIDTQTEKIIQKGLERLLKGRTSFVIAHRLSTITAADLIVVMDHGRIVEQGSHQALLEQGGMYRDLYTMAYAKPLTQVN
ncbi:putative ABC transporter ATP-binding protein [Anaerolineae bacterium]|nr:putative ABC transporter ATP-binding protein [Anaerolineae bacterium]